MFQFPLNLLILILWLLPAPEPAHAASTHDRLCRALESRQTRLEERVAEREAAGHTARALGRVLTRAQDDFADHCIRINQIQVVGTHNSYHVELPPQLLQMLIPVDPRATAWEYGHLPLDQQFTFQGIRQIELDAYYDPDGGLYAEPFFLPLALRDPDARRIPELDPPGIKVLHVQELDFLTNCLTLIDCLGTVKRWSDGHPDHVPIFIMLELKDDPISEFGGAVVPLPWDVEAVAALDDEIRSVFPPGQLITPDDVRGSHRTLRDAVLDDGWPTLGEARGKVLFWLLDPGVYRVDRPSLEGRVAFVTSSPGLEDAAVVGGSAPEAVEQGFLVRRRADGDTEEARVNDTRRRDEAFASGAQFISTDYPDPDPRFGTGYQVRIPGGTTVRCNPVNAPPGCRDAALER